MAAVMVEGRGAQVVQAPVVYDEQDTLLGAVRWLCAHHGVALSEAALRAGLPRGGRLSPTLALRIMEQAGIGAGWVKRDIGGLLSHLFPIAVMRKDGGACILTARHGSGDSATYEVVFPDAGDGSSTLGVEEMNELYAGHALLAKPRARLDDRAGSTLEHTEGHWLFSTLWRYRRYYASAALAALLINVLTLASTFFTMNVYDRVVPNQAYATLWSLAIGVVVAMVFETVARHVRSHLVDVAGKKADLILGAMLFRKVLSTRMEFKSKSAGSSANQLREFESVRDFVTSATIATLSDLPFVLLFVGIIFLIGGPLALVPLLAIPIIIVLSVAIQWPLARVMQENLRESSLKQGLLIEAIEGLESLKAARGEGVMQQKWESFSALSATSSMKSRALSSLTVNLVTLIQQLQTVILVVWGVYLIHAGELTQGALFGVVMLAGRATSPLAAVVGLAIRFQQAKTAMRSLGQIMAQPQERSPDRRYLAKPEFRGAVTLKKIGFSYPAPPMQPAPTVLQDINLDFKPGERVALLGNIGCGKSTLLRIMASMYQPTSGQVLMDGIDVVQIDPADVRAAVGLLSQDARLFHGTLKDNVIIGNPATTTEQFLYIAKLTGIDAIAARHPRGYDMPIGEAGQGLSGGQRQLVALARCLLLRPRVLLMDEPTSSMDLQTERFFLEKMAVATRGQTLIVATHRLSVLNLVDRIIVMDTEGKVTANGPKDAVLASLRGTSPASVAGATA
ncbi:type I secretion system permease/ATPase [Variovorax sp. J22R133]|uniref:type I secretion system permease/ATPase n=1 Tax=Variovorax brevis TaxID=3053503 RepID=UPI00257802D9|nr:type I secretion system permease/ATPase [Variovorax sp. J22R133]MDM0115521.1 type I secretion system permease/ATPase [Variovorax sp. J22R133]